MLCAPATASPSSPSTPSRTGARSSPPSRSKPNSRTTARSCRTPSRASARPTARPSTTASKGSRRKSSATSRALYQIARQEMNQLARESGGKTFAVADLRDAQRAFRQVAEDIGTQYSLGYYPTNKARDGSFRTIRVQVRNPKDAQVRAREGY